MGRVAVPPLQERAASATDTLVVKEGAPKGHAGFPQPAVSPHFRFDWNYALRIFRLPAFKFGAQLVIATPLIAQFVPLMDLHQTPVWLLWLASALFLIGFAVLKVRAPMFLQEYRNYKEYSDWGHAHRWIVWLFHTHLLSMGDTKDLLTEVVSKGLAVPIEDDRAAAAHRGTIRARLGQGLAEGRMLRSAKNAGGPAVGTRDSVLVVKPVSFKADIYLPFSIGEHEYVLSMEESDSMVREHERTLFWVIFSACASSRLRARIVVWLLFAASIACFLAAMVMILSSIVFAAGSSHHGGGGHLGWSVV